ncbi:MAG: CbtA family protein, partial [Algicola sp.]|nr:CbtA family protein [Algicola sp.]
HQHDGLLEQEKRNDQLVTAAAHQHNSDEWSPEDGRERTGYTIASNILAAIGFAAIILSGMSFLQVQGKIRLYEDKSGDKGAIKGVFKGIVCGAAGFIVFFVTPGRGLPPEIPGTEAAAIENRQTWWLLAVGAAAIAVYIAAFAKTKLKWLALLVIALPFIIGAPHHTVQGVAGPAFTHPDPQVVARLTELHHQFIVATGLSNLFFWLLLGGACAWALSRSASNDWNDKNVAG